MRARKLQTDWILAISLSALFLMSATLHIREIGRTRLALPPVFAVLEFGGDGVPIVGGLRLERSADWNGLEYGDRLIRVGETSLEGVSYAAFDAIVMAEAGSASSVPLVYERDGQRFVVDLQMQAYAQPWSRLPLMAALALVATFVLLRAPGTRHARLFFASIMLIAAAELPFYGGPRIQSYAYVALFNVALPIGLFLWFRWIIGFPEGVRPDKRLSPALAWIVLLFPLARIPYHLGGLIPAPVVPSVVLTTDAIFAASSVAILTWNYAHADPIGRRQVKWIVFGAYVGCLPLLIASAMTIVTPGRGTALEFHDLLPLVMIAPLAIVAGTLIGILRHNLFDIDRLMTRAAAYSASGALALGAALALVQLLASVISDGLSIDEAHARLVLTILLGAVAIPVTIRMRRPIEHFFFPRRRDQQQGVQQLLVDIDDCDRPPLVADLVATRVGGLFEPEYVTTVDARLRRPRTVDGPEARGLETDGAFVRALASHPWPAFIDRDRFDAVRVGVPAIASPGEPSAPAIVVPLRDGKDLAFILLVGPPRSGDEFTSTDLSLLTTVAERASSQLRALRDHDALETERIRVDELRELKEAAERAHQSRSRFLAAASHDLRQPLHALGLFVESLSESVERGPTDPELVRRIQGSARSVEAMFDSLLDISRLDVGAVEARLSRFEVEPVLSQIADELGPDAERKGLALRVDSKNEWVKSDPVLLARIVRNLAVNAVRYTAEGSVTLATRQAGDDVWIEVRDTGPGIPDHRRAEIFDEFTQLEPEGGEGLGLGLSIVSRLSALLGHEIVVESSTRGGSTFSCRVPLSAAPTAQDREPEGARATDLSGHRVLVVDDDLSILEAMARQLRGWGCEVTLARNLDDVEESLAHGPAPDALLSDLRLLDGESGLQVIDVVRRTTGADTPAALISGESATSIPDGVRWLRKPVAPMRLRALLTELLSEGRSETHEI